MMKLRFAPRLLSFCLMLLVPSIGICADLTTPRFEVTDDGLVVSTTYRGQSALKTMKLVVSGMEDHSVTVTPKADRSKKVFSYTFTKPSFTRAARFQFQGKTKTSRRIVSPAKGLPSSLRYHPIAISSEYTLSGVANATIHLPVYDLAGGTPECRIVSFEGQGQILSEQGCTVKLALLPVNQGKCTIRFYALRSVDRSRSEEAELSVTWVATGNQINVPTPTPTPVPTARAPAAQAPSYELNGSGVQTLKASAVVDETIYECVFDSIPEQLTVDEWSSCTLSVHPKNHCVEFAQVYYRLRRKDDGVLGQAGTLGFRWLQAADGRAPIPPGIPDGNPHGLYVGVHLVPELIPLPVLNVTSKNYPFGIVGIFRDMREIADGDYQDLRRFINDARATLAIPFITITAIDGYAAYSTEDLTNLACYLKYERIPIFVRWLHEMNGFWFPWGGSPTLYKEKFAEFARIMHSGAPNVSTVWSPNHGYGYPWKDSASLSTHPDFNLMDTNHDGQITQEDDPYAPYYPGDENVDWVGASMFFFGENQSGKNALPGTVRWAEMQGHWGSFHSIHNLARDHGKPFVVSETGALFDPYYSKGGTASEFEVKTAWMKQVFNLSDPSIPNLRDDFPQLKAIMWLNVEKYEEGYKEFVNWRVDTNPDVLNYFTSITADPYFSPPTY